MEKNYQTASSYLLPRDNLDKTQTKNYRPISLLNVDLKIISKAFTNKFQPQMPNPYTQISRKKKPTCQTHTGRSVGRKMQNHSHFIRDIIIIYLGKKIQAAIIGLHEEKGLHNVAHNYVFKTITICPTTQDRFLQYAKSLKDRDKTDLETPFSLKHLKNVLTKRKFIKSPGLDGHTT